MANATFVNFRSGLKHPKLSWVISMLNKYGIAHNVVPGLKGITLQVEQGGIEIASTILTQELGSFDAVALNNEDQPPVRITVTVDDLPDDHEFFQLEPTPLRVVKGDFKKDSLQKQVDKIVEAGGTPVLGPQTDDEIDAEFDAAIGSAKNVTPVVEEDDDDDDWDFGDEDDEEPVPTPDPVEEPATDPDFVAEEAPKVSTPKKKKKMKEKKEAVDPDFDAAVDSTDDLSSPVDGTEFLEVDKVLQFEDIQFKDVKSGPIRMYDVNSSTLSAIGAKVLNSDPLVVTFYVRFKAGGSVYRYNPVPTADWNTIVNLCIRRTVHGVQEASGGSFLHHAIKVKAEEGLIKCQRLTDASWVTVLSKAERTKAIKKRD